MASQYGFTPSQVGKMTLYQIRCLLVPEDELGKMKFRSFGAQREYVEMMADPKRRTQFMLDYLGVQCDGA